MKKFVALVLMAMFLVSSAMAADVSAYEKHATIDLTPFKTAAYSGSFDNMKFSAEIYADNCTIKSAATGTLTEEFTLKFDIKMVYSGGSAQFYPRMLLNSTLWTYFYLNEIYVKVGENRYCIGIAPDRSSYTGRYSNSYYENEVIVMGPSAMKMLEDIATANKPVSIKYYGNYSSDAFTLTSAQVAGIKAFYEDCKKSGMLDQPSFLVSTDDCRMVTNFN